jgi:hypothetical protein
MFKAELLVLFIRFIIRLFQLVILAETVFFSHNKSANSVFQPAYQHSRTAPLYPDTVCERHQALVSPSRTYKTII